MTTTAFDACLETLTAVARSANAAELDHQREAALRAAELKRARAFAWRRVNLLRAVAGAMRGAEDAAAAEAAGTAALLREAGWGGAAEAERAAASRFLPVIAAIRAAGEAEADPAAALADFEAWYAAERGAPFLALMEREIVELPLVDI